MGKLDLSLVAPLDALLQEGSVKGAARRLGISASAMSRALDRTRRYVGDPLLVRSGRTMVLTPRAEALRPKVKEALESLALALEPARPFTPAGLERTFVLHASDYLAAVLGARIEALIRAESKRISLYFRHDLVDESVAVRSTDADLALGTFSALPSEVRTRMLLSDPLVVVLRRGHPAARSPLDLETYAGLEHVHLAGGGGDLVADALLQHGLERRVACSTPFALCALLRVAESDVSATVPRRIAERMAAKLDLAVLEPPVALPPRVSRIVWHPRFDGDGGHRWLREQIIRAAKPDDDHT